MENALRLRLNRLVLTRKIPTGKTKNAKPSREKYAEEVHVEQISIDTCSFVRHLQQTGKEKENIHTQVNRAQVTARVGLTFFICDSTSNASVSGLARTSAFDTSFRMN